MGQDKESEAGSKRSPSALGGRLGDWLRRRRTSGGTGPERRRAEDHPSAPRLSDPELESLKRAYLRHLYARFRSLYLYGLDERRASQQTSGQALDLTAVYTPLNTTLPAPPDARAEPKDLSPSTPQTPPSAPEKNLSALAVIGREGRAIVRGSHGSGKSTLLRYLALSLAERTQQGACTGLSRLGDAWSHGCPLPVWIDLYALADSPHNDGSAQGICKQIADDWYLLPDQLRDQVIRPGGLFFLIDGLEMAPGAAADFYRQFKDTDNHFLFTSAPFVDLSNWRALRDLFEITLAPWTLDRMDQFVSRWYTELECKQWIDPETARDLPGQLRSALRRDEVRGLACQPAVMVLIALLHTINGGLPRTRVAFYDQVIDLSLTHWTEGRVPAATITGQESTDSPPTVAPSGPTRDLRQAFDLDALQAKIAQVTYDRYARLHTTSERVELSESDLRAALINVSRQGRKEAADTLIKRMRTRPALLDERQPGIYVYVDPRLQVHAAAYHLAAQPDLSQVAVALAHEDYERWHEIILLAGIRLADVDGSLPAALELADALCRPLGPRVRQETTPEMEWRLACLSGEMLAEIAQELEMPRPMHTLECVESRLAALLERGMLTPTERTRAGSVLDRLPDGDRRPGVSSSNLLWCPVPAGDFWQGEGQAAQTSYVGTFWMSRYPVTNAQYAAYVRATGQPAPKHWQGSHPPAGTGNRPIVHVTWEQAKQYCAWYTDRILSEPFLAWHLHRVETLDRAPSNVSRDWVARLPTSQEWEKAARGGLVIPGDTETDRTALSKGQFALVDNPMPRRTYPWGNEWHLSASGTAGDETRCNVSESGIGTTTPVGMYPSGSSPYGLMDMAGNVWEWCLDWADEQERYKIRKGGAFRFTHEHAQCAAYDKAYPGLGWPHLGFRVVLAPRPGGEK